MKIPSATGIVFASLALSGSTLAAPTGSPIPNSPNPGLNSPRAELDSPRFANSPDINSPRAANQAFFLSRRNRHKRSISTSAQGPSAGLGLVAHEKPIAAPMQRSLAQLSLRDDQTVNAAGLGVIDQPTADNVKNALHSVAEQLDDRPAPVGPALGGVMGTFESLIRNLGPSTPHPSPAPRSIPHWMRRQTPDPNTDPNTDPASTVSAQGLGILTPDQGKQVQDALAGMGSTVGNVPMVGGLLEGAVNAVGGVVAGLVTRDEQSAIDAGLGAAVRDPHRQRNVDPSTITSIPFGTLGTSTGFLPEGISSVPSAVLGEVIGPDGRVYQAFGQLPAGVQMIPATAANIPPTIQQTAGGRAGVAASHVPTGSPNPTSLLDPTQIPGQAGDMLPTAAITGLAGGALGAVGGLGNIIGFTPDGIPIFGALSTATGLAGGVVNAAGQTVSGVAQTATGALGGTPVGGIVNGETVANSPLGGVVGGATGLASGVPIAGGLLQGVLGSLPGTSGSSGGFGILSEPDAAISVTSMLPTSTISVTAIASSLPSQGHANATSADVDDDDDDDDDDVDDDEFGDDSDDEDPAGEGKDTTDDNDTTTSASVPTPTTTSLPFSNIPTMTSAYFGTPTASVPSSR